MIGVHLLGCILLSATVVFGFQAFPESPYVEGTHQQNTQHSHKIETLVDDVAKVFAFKLLYKNECIVLLNVTLNDMKMETIVPAPKELQLGDNILKFCSGFEIKTSQDQLNGMNVTTLTEHEHTAEGDALTGQKHIFEGEVKMANMYLKRIL